MKVSIVIPCYEEHASLCSLLPALQRLLPGAEILVVWDGPDDRTEDLCRSLGARSVQGSGEGLGSAIVQGIYTARYNRVIVMDGDGQHPPAAIVGIASKLQQVPLVAGARYSQTAMSPVRHFMSKGCGWIARPLCSQKDIMTGLFGLDRTIIDKESIYTGSWKIGLEIFAKADYSEYAEEGYSFASRIAGESKAGIKPAIQFLLQLARLYAWKINLTQMMQFCIVGTSGLLVNMGILLTLVELFGLDYRPAAILGIGTAMFWNYLWNKFWTFRRAPDGHTYKRSQRKAIRAPD